MNSRRIKKTLLLASMALAAIALVAPAAAQAELEWYSAGGKLTEEAGFEATGHVSSTGSGIVTGPAQIHVNGFLFNENGMGSGTITGGSITGPISTNLPGCTATATINNATLPWSITLTTPDTMDIGSEGSKITFTNHYSEGGGAGCPKFKVPATVSAQGVVTATIENRLGEEVCMDLDVYLDDLVNEVSMAPINLSTPLGSICLQGLEAK